MTNVRDYGARGDGRTDDTAAITHAVQRGDGELTFPRGDYLITRPIYLALQQHGRLAVRGSGGTARLLMAGAGPALHLAGSHRRSAHPDQFVDAVWERERFPTISDLEIIGRDPAADGIRIDGAMQPTLRGLVIRRVRHGIHLLSRDRNVLIADCHVYHNTGIGVFLDRVNLHQTIIHGCHISYCKAGGIQIAGSEIRNLQMCSNDIEYNYDLKAKTSADVLLDCRNGTVREGTLVGNTVQAVESPGGANVRLLGAGRDDPNAVGLFTITGNLIGSQHTAIDLNACRAVVISGNSIYSGYRHAIHAEDCEHLVIGSNSVDHNPEYRGRSTDQLIFRRCRNVALTGCVIQHTREATAEVRSSVEADGCRNFSMTGCQVINARGVGVALQGCQVARVADCTIRGRDGDKTYRAAVTVDKGSSQVMVTNNFLGTGSDGEFRLPPKAGAASGNLMV